MTGDRLVWERDGTDWPNRDSSLFVNAGGVRWHVQQRGSGPHLLLLHGTGAATHSWRDLLPLLATDFTVTAPDLPGHGFTNSEDPKFLSLPGMAQAVTELLNSLQVGPVCGVGHSAGAAILARMSLTGTHKLPLIVAVNGALLPFEGFAAYLFSPVAKFAASMPFLSSAFARRAATSGSVERLLAGTGSTIDARGIELYARLLRTRGHIAGALGMMASWDLGALARDLPQLKSELVLVAAGDDATISPEEAFRVRTLLPAAIVEYLRGLGHLAHEEAPETISALIKRHAHTRALI